MLIKAIIPALNEARTIGPLIEAISKQGIEPVVVDDGSTDATGEIARQAKATVIKNPVNLGKGASLRKAFDYLAPLAFDAAVILDGDGQHAAEEIPIFVEALRRTQAGVIIGNRMLDKKNMPWIRVITNKTMSWLISRIARQRIPDTQCGFRLLTQGLIRKLNLRSYKYEIESEILIQAARLGFKIESVPIRTIYQGEQSRINPFIDTFRFITFIMKELWISRR